MEQEPYHGGHGKERRPRVFFGFRALHLLPWPLWLLLLVLTVPGCLRARANVVPNGPPLDVPQPPPRIVLPVEVPVETEAPPPEPGPPPDEPRRPAAPARPRPAGPVEAAPYPIFRRWSNATVGHALLSARLHTV